MIEVNRCAADFKVAKGPKLTDIDPSLRIQDRRKLDPDDSLEPELSRHKQRAPFAAAQIDVRKAGYIIPYRHRAQGLADVPGTGRHIPFAIPVLFLGDAGRPQ